MQVIDSHFHWYPRSHFERVSARVEQPRAERLGDGYRYFYNEGRAHIDLPGVWFELEEGLARMDRAAADTSVICTLGVLSGFVDQLPTSEAIEAAAAWNEEMAAAQRAHPGRFFGTATVPLGDEKEAIGLLDDAVERLGLCGVNLPAISAGELVDVARLEPFYDRVEELGVPLIVHPTDLIYGEVLTGYERGLQLTVGRLLDSSLTVLRLIFAGVLERHPRLRLVHTHAGGLLPYQSGRIDKNANQKALPELPSAYLRRIFVDTVAPQALTIRTAMEYYGEDHVLYGTDYPCWDPDAALQVVTEADLGAARTAGVLSGNVRQVFALEPDAGVGGDHH